MRCRRLSPRARPFSSKASGNYRDGAPPKLAEEIKGFTTQEAIHSREHDAFNKAAADAGYDLKPLEDRVQMRLDFIRSKPPIASLAVDHGARAFHRHLRA